MLRYVIFGAGQCAHKAIDLLGKENIEMILDNNASKWGENIENIQIYNPDEKAGCLENYQVVVSVSQKYQQQIVDQLSQMGIKNVETIQEIQTEITKRKLENRLGNRKLKEVLSAKRKMKKIST